MILEIATILALANFILGIYLYWKIKDFYKYPNNFGFPIIGNLYCFYKGLWASSIHETFEYGSEIVDKYGGGDMCLTLIYGRIAVILACPHITEKIAFNPKVADKAEPAYSGVNSLARGVFAHCRSDQEWKQKRKEMNTSLTKSRIDGPYTELFINVGKYLTDNMAKNPNNVDISYECFFASINAVKGSFYGVQKFTPPSKRLYETLILLLKMASKALSNPIFGQLYFHLAGFLDSTYFSATNSIRKQIIGENNIFKNRIGKLHEQDSSTLPLSSMIALRHKQLKLPAKELRRELYELIIAGSHTVSVSLSASIAYFGMFPDIQEKAWKEQYEIFGDDTRDPTLEDLKKMVYLERFMKEIYRIYSPPYIVKQTSGDINIGGPTLPAGCLVFIMMYKMRTDPRYWEDPEKFNPERFLNEEGSRPKYSFTSFGVGVRSCPGMTYTKQEMKIILSTVLRRYKIHSDQKPENVQLQKQLMVEPVRLDRLRIEERKY